MWRKKAVVTPAEMEVLWDLWDYGPSKVKEMLERRNEGKLPNQQVGYTAIQNQLYKLRHKGLVTVDGAGVSGRSCLYRAHNKSEILSLVLKEACADYFGGSLLLLFRTVSELDVVSVDELKSIRSKLNEKLK